MPNTSIPAAGEAMPATLAAAIAQHEAAHAAWTATTDEDGELPTETPEDEAAWAAELAMINFPCTTSEDMRTKVSYLYLGETEAARGARDTAKTNDFTAFLGSLIGIDPESGKTVLAEETPHDELRRLSWRIADLLNDLDPRVEYVTIRPSNTGTGAVMTGFYVPIPGFDQIEDFFHRWKDAEARADAADDDEAVEVAQVEYNALQDLITEQTPRTAREFAMWILAQSDRWAAGITDELRNMTDTLAGEKEGAR